MTHNAVAGTYAGVYIGDDLGYTVDGFNIDYQALGVNLQAEDFGQSVITTIHSGASIFVEAIFKEWRSEAIFAAFWPWAGQSEADEDNIGMENSIGKSVVKSSGSSKLCGSLVLTADACANANSHGGTVWTFHKASIDPEHIKRLNFNNLPRLLPLRFIVYLTQPNLDDVSPSSTPRFFTVSTP